MKLGNNILKLRKKKGISQEQLGEKINVTRQTISNWELGETFPNPEQLKLLSKELDVSVDELLNNDIKNVLVEKVSNTEKLAGLILNFIKFLIVFIIIVPILIIIANIVFKSIREKNSGRVMNISIICSLHNETYSYEFTYYEETAQIKEAGGDAYLANITGIEKYSDVHQALDIIDAYVKNNGGTCKKVENRYLNDIIDMQIKEDTLSKKEATIIIKNNSDYDITFGEYFWIEKYDNKTYSFEILNELPNNNCGFNDIAYVAKQGEFREFKHDWSCMYGSLDKGLYRLVKDVFFESDIPIDDDDKYYIWVEFEIS